MHWMFWKGMDGGWNLTWLAVVGAAAGLAIYFAHRLSPPAEKSPEDILRERFARGDISEEEFQRRLRRLRGP